MNDFFADSMLGKLARFLRFFGYDTLYRKEQSVDKMLEIATRESRIVLSQSKDVMRLSAKNNIHAIQLPTSSIQDQLRILLNEFNLNLDFPPAKMRCSICNGSLEEKPKKTILEEIPERTAKYYDEFWQCQECRKIYWVGSHWKDIKRIIEEISE